MVRLETMRLAQLLLGVNGALGALTVDLDNQDSIKEAASLVAEDLMTFYKGEEKGEIPGILPGPPPNGDYYWWTGAMLWTSLIDYRNRSGDTTYDETIMRGIQWQTGPTEDFMPLNWSATIANDDQTFWGLTALFADLSEFKDPAATDPQWLPLAKAVFDEQSYDDRRVHDGDCEGALRWQIFQINNGYDYVSSTANIGYFKLGSQLAYLTNNGTISDLAEDTYKLLTDIGIVDGQFNVYDGVRASNCDGINKLQLSHNAGMLLEGSAYLYSYTGDDDWRERIDGLLGRTLEVFFPDGGAAVEPACETAGTCTVDMQFARGILLRSLAATARLAPHTAATILPVLRTSAAAAAARCAGGDSGNLCGFSWTTADAAPDGLSGAAAQANALSALVSVLGDVTAVTQDGSAAAAGSGSEGETPGNAGARSGISVGVALACLLFSMIAGI